MNTVEALLKQLPDEFAQALRLFCESYQKTLESEEAFASCLPILCSYFEQVQKQIEAPYTFSHFHQKERSPFDFFTMARELVRPLIDQEKSSLTGKETLFDIEQALQRKENVVLLSNHQTEIDPQIISLMVEPYSPLLAQETISIAGHRVTTDPLAVPFSRGCNLICIYSKKYIENPPEEKAHRLQHNARSLAKIEEQLQNGGAAFYVAPSGGRDRWDESGLVQIAPFDPQSIEMFRLFAKRTSIPTHFYLLTLATIQLLPPPKTRQISLGEERLVKRGPAHLHFSQELFFDEAPEGVDKKQFRQERADLYTKRISDTHHALTSQGPV